MQVEYQEKVAGKGVYLARVGVQGIDRKCCASRLTRVVVKSLASRACIKANKTCC